jgi:hypothetical protein
MNNDQVLDALLTMMAQIYYLNDAPVRDMRHSPTIEAASILKGKIQSVSNYRIFIYTYIHEYLKFQ